MPTAVPPAHLSWTGAEALPDPIRAQLLGPGAPFEMRTEDVLGVRMQVFAQRPRQLIELLRQACARHGAAVYMTSAERTLTYGEVVAPIATAARALQARFGVGRGDRVAIASANSIEYAVTFWAATALGAITVGLNGWWTASELASGIALTEPKVIFADDRRAERLAEAGYTGDVVVFDGQWWGAEHDDAALPDLELDEDDPFLILFTSGTTGAPKGALLSHRGAIHFNMASALNGAIGALTNAAATRPPDVAGTASAPAAAALQPCVLSASPMFHVSGMTAQVIMALSSGMRIVYPPPGRWDERAHVALSEAHAVTRWSLVPTQLWRILELPELGDYPLPALGGIGGGSAVWPPELLRQALERLPQIRPGLALGYGMTETTGLGTALGGDRLLAHPTSVGSPSPGVDVEVRDPDTGSTLRCGEVGEICIRTAAGFLGYWRNPAATQRALDADRWYHTGDYGVIRDGLLYLEGRRSDLIIRGGENIYPAEIENRIVEHPAVSECAVVGVAHHQLGQEVVAHVVPLAGAPLDPEELRRFVGAALAAFKVPARIVIRADLPRNATGKVLRHELHDEPGGN